MADILFAMRFVQRLSCVVQRTDVHTELSASCLIQCFKRAEMQAEGGGEASCVGQNVTQVSLGCLGQRSPAGTHGAMLQARRITGIS